MQHKNMAIINNASKPIHKFDDNPEWWLKFVPKTSPWTDVNILRFMRLYQSYPVLWNKFHADYRNRRVRLLAYRDIAKTLKLKNVDEKECMRLVELLKRRYVEEKEFGGNVNRPAWFNIIASIIRRILNPEKIEGKESPSFEACKKCCAKQNLIAPCCYYDPSQKSSSTFHECKSCCAKQNLQAPCDYYQTSQRSITSLNNSFQRCKSCCVKQNLQPPCEYYEDFKEKLNSKDDITSKEELQCFTIAPMDMKLVLINFERPYVKEDCQGDLDKDSVCDCCSDGSSVSESSTETEEDQNCACSSNGQSKQPSTSSSFDSRNYCIQDFSVFQRTLETLCLMAKSNNGNCEKESETVMSSELPEKYNDDIDNIVAAKPGLFVDSSRSRGKQISLVVEKRWYDDFDGHEEIIESRRHVAPCTRASEIYPLQLDM